MAQIRIYDFSKLHLYLTNFEIFAGKMSNLDCTEVKFCLQRFMHIYLSIFEPRVLKPIYENPLALSEKIYIYISEILIIII